MYCLDKIVNPGIFQGKNKRKHYFEGWYFKLTDQSMEHTVAVIPGIAIGDSLGDAHAFIQILLEGSQVCYYSFDIREFKFNKQRFAIRIGQNYFSDNKLSINLKGRGIDIHGTVRFYNLRRLPQTFYRPGIMGPFTYIPWMECYHGVVSIQHDIVGQLMIGRERLDFTGGYGYIEKDWGSSFPKSWVWLQTNHFKQSDATLMFSAARIPMLGTSFPGFLALLRIADRIHVFATYTGAKLRSLKCSEKQVSIILEDRRYRMEILVSSTEGGYLKAPFKGLMNRTIQESVHNKARIRLFNKHKKLLYQDIARNTGLEIVLQDHKNSTLN